MRTLEDMLEEITPTPDPDFVEEMERRMQAGFPPRRAAGARRAAGLRLPGFASRLAPSRLRIPRAAAAVAASAVLALLVTVSLVGDDGAQRDDAAIQPLQDSSGGAESAETRVRGGHPTADEVMPGDPGASSIGLPAPVPPPGQDVAPRAQTRRVERSAQLTLAADSDEFDDLSDAVFRVTDRHEGFVVRSSTTQDDDLAAGFFELRIPADRLDRALTDLSRIATVRSRSDSGTDVTGTFVSIRDRLRTARAEQTSLLRRLENADTDDAARAIRRRLEIVENRIAGLRGQLSGVRQRTRYATVLVDLVDEDAGAVTGDTGRAVDDAVGSLEDVLNFSIRALGVLIPLGLAVLVGWLAAARARRRARERALA